MSSKLSQFFKSQYEVSFDPEKEIIITAGSKIAIYMALLAVINPGDEVITPPNSFVASTAAIVHLGAKPVFVDIKDDYNIDESKIVSAITMQVILSATMAAAGTAQESVRSL